MSIGPDPTTFRPIHLPFFPPTNLFLEKIRCAGERRKAVDLEDVHYLYDRFVVREHEIDLKKLKRSISREDYDRAINHHPSIRPLLDTVMAAV